MTPGPPDNRPPGKPPTNRPGPVRPATPPPPPPGPKTEVAMHRIPGAQITDRLPVDSDAWKYHHEEWTDARAADGYRLGSRWRSGRRAFWLDFTATLANITFPSMALWLLLLAIQGQHLMYVAQTVVMLP